MARGPRLLHALALGFLAAPRLVHALPIALVEQDRVVAVEASASAQGVSDADAESDSTTAPGYAGLLVSLLAEAGSDAFSTPAAQQFSQLSADEIAGDGLVDAGAFGLTPDAFAIATADTRLRIVFTATADTTLRLTGQLVASGTGPGFATALLELSALDASVDPLLLLYETDSDGVTERDVDVLAALRGGVTYRLLALARLDTDTLGFESGSFVATFRFELTEVPEPGTALLIAVGLALLTRRR
jgi:hypothetical protein